MSSGALRIVLAALACLATANAASAEIAFFATGRTMSIKGHREDGASIVLLLRGGGEITCPRAVITEIVPDEVPVPDDSVAVAAVAAAIQVPPEYDAMIARSAARLGVDPNLVRAVIQVESAYRAEARSRKGAMGLMQLMPDTARRFAVKNPYDPGSNIEGGIKYLKFLLDRYDATVSLALAAYNAGEAAVEKFRGIPPYSETRNYVQAVLKLADVR